ncbi:hypothetical protein [Ruegeria halocynthiae]|uniref:hypothetical protein n=1 Tax=Ruegeria halocynthiae TaxID=985054 RepID=UPI00068CE43C|nr:hypothetical protein [Ruegeria halocynthiae]
MCDSWIEVIKEWQTLVAGLLALGAAFLTIRTMRKQMVNESIRHESQLRRQKKAARAKMPDALSEMSEYARQVGGYLLETQEEPPQPPSASITTLQQVIEYIDDDAADRAFELASLFQVQHARMTSSGPKRQHILHKYDIALLQAYTNSLFDYARNEVESVSNEKPSREDMRTATVNVFDRIRINQNRPLFSELQKLIESKH